QRTVTAGPESPNPQRAAMPGSIQLKRPIASARFAALIPRKRASSAAGSRGGAGSTRKPILPALGIGTPWGGDSRYTSCHPDTNKESVDAARGALAFAAAPDRHHRVRGAEPWPRGRRHAGDP